MTICLLQWLDRFFHQAFLIDCSKAKEQRKKKHSKKERDKLRKTASQVSDIKFSACPNFLHHLTYKSYWCSIIVAIAALGRFVIHN